MAAPKKKRRPRAPSDIIVTLTAHGGAVALPEKEAWALRDREPELRLYRYTLLGEAARRGQ